MMVSRRAFMRGATGLAAASATVTSRLAGAQPPSRPLSRPPNILWLMTDQQPTSTLGCYGNPLDVTPAVDRLAAEGVRFDAFYIAAFPCSPSRASYFTGRYAHQHGIVTNEVLLDPAIPALGALCAQAGYDTAFFGKSHLSGEIYRDGKPTPRHPIAGGGVKRRVDSPDGYKFEWVEGGVGEDAPQMGFKEWAGGWRQYREYLTGVGLGKLLEGPGKVGNHNMAPQGAEGTHTYSRIPAEHHEVSFFRQRAVEFLSRRQRGAAPFCMVVSFYGPHLPVAPPKPWDTKYSLEQVKLPANHRDDLQGKPRRQQGDKQKTGKWSDEQFLDYIRRYYGYCAYIDSQVELILKALDETGQTNDTIVVFTTDHGDMIGAHGMIYKLNYCGYEELLRVPFVLRYPRLAATGRSVGALVSSVDALPTLLDLAGVPAPKELAGRSFRSLLEASAAPAASFREYVVCDSSGTNFTVREGRWKYVCNWAPPRDLDELYDLQADPGELRNLAYDNDHAAQRARMRELLGGWLKDTGHPYAAIIIEAMNGDSGRGGALRPVVTRLKLLDSNRLELAYEWRVSAFTQTGVKNQTYCHFINPKYATEGAIAFRHKQWTDKPTTEWRDGDTIPVGPVVVEIPATAGSGDYEVRIGLFDPTKQGQLALRGRGANYVVVGALAIRRNGAAIESATFTPTAQ